MIPPLGVRDSLENLIGIALCIVIAWVLLH